MSKRQLLFKATEEEEEYLTKTGQINNWHDTVRAWINRDKKINVKSLADKIQNSFILIFIGILAFMFTLFLPVNMYTFILSIILGIISLIAVSYGALSIIWELILYARR